MNSTGIPAKGLPGAADRCDVRIIRAVVSIEEEPCMGHSQLFGGRLGVRPRDPEVSVGVAGVSRRHPHAGDAFDIGDRRVADPVGTDAKFSGPCQVLDSPSESFEPLVVEMPTVLSMEHKAAAVVSKGSVGHQPGDEVSRDRDPPLLGVLLNETNCS